MLTCIDFETGKLRWRDPSIGKGSLTAADGMLYLLSEKGTVALARPRPKPTRRSRAFRSRPEPAELVPNGRDGRAAVNPQRSELLCYNVKRSG